VTRHLGNHTDASRRTVGGQTEHVAGNHSSTVHLYQPRKPAHNVVLFTTYGVYGHAKSMPSRDRFFTRNAGSVSLLRNKARLYDIPYMRMCILLACISHITGGIADPTIRQRAEPQMGSVRPDMFDCRCFPNLSEKRLTFREFPTMIID